MLNLSIKIAKILTYSMLSNCDVVSIKRTGRQKTPSNIDLAKRFATSIILYRSCNFGVTKPVYLMLQINFYKYFWDLEFKENICKK